jgi:hypothetical protein
MNSNDFVVLKIDLTDPADKLPQDSDICNYVVQNYQTQITPADIVTHSTHLNDYLVIRLYFTGSRSKHGLNKNKKL